jgi:hypothetical protein
MPAAHEVCFLWSGRHFLPKVSVSSQIESAYHLTDARYNWAHRKLYNRLVQLGAQPVCDRGESDEQHPEGYVNFSV